MKVRKPHLMSLNLPKTHWAKKAWLVQIKDLTIGVVYKQPDFPYSTGPRTVFRLEPKITGVLEGRWKAKGKGNFYSTDHYLNLKEAKKAMVKIYKKQLDYLVKTTLETQDS